MSSGIDVTGFNSLRYAQANLLPNNIRSNSSIVVQNQPLSIAGSARHPIHGPPRPPRPRPPAPPKHQRDSAPPGPQRRPANSPPPVRERGASANRPPRTAPRRRATDESLLRRRPPETPAGPPGQHRG